MKDGELTMPKQVDDVVQIAWPCSLGERSNLLGEQRLVP
jgi:hypothetical protein